MAKPKNAARGPARPRKRRKTQTWRTCYAYLNSHEIHLAHGEVIISAQDLDLVQKYTWHTRRNPDGYLSVKASVRDPRGRVQSVYLARLIMNPPAGYQADHRNGNPLDNRRENLQAIPAEENAYLATSRKKPWQLGKTRGEENF